MAYSEQKGYNQGAVQGNAVRPQTPMEAAVSDVKATLESLHCAQTRFLSRLTSVRVESPPVPEAPTKQLTTALPPRSELEADLANIKERLEVMIQRLDRTESELRI